MRSRFTIRRAILGKQRIIAVWVGLGLPLLACAQDHGLKLPSFSGLRGTAIESVDVTIGPTQLQLLKWMLPDSDPESVAMAKMMEGLKRVSVRSYRFGADFSYPQADIDALRSQLSGPAWSQLVKVRDRTKNENVDVYLAVDHDKINGLAVIASDPRELTIVNIVGSIDLKQMATLQRQLHLPEAGMEQLLQNVQ
jgi:hypothetical protein